MNEMTKECFACGNANENELEYKKVSLDDGWKESKKYVWTCKDPDDCGMRMFGPKK